MSDRPDPSERTSLDELRDELGAQFAQLPASPRNARRRWRPAAVLVVAALVLAPTAVALAGGFSRGETHTIYVHGETVEVDGEVIDCPATLVMIKELEANPCRDATVPAAAPVLSPGSPCPDFVKDFLRSVDRGDARFSDYDQLPGYPFKDCPKAEELAPFYRHGDRERLAPDSRK